MLLATLIVFGWACRRVGGDAVGGESFDFRIRDLSPHQPTSRILILASTRSFTCIDPARAARRALPVKVKVKINVKVRSSGRGRPLHTSSAGAARVLAPFPVAHLLLPGFAGSVRRRWGLDWELACPWRVSDEVAEAAFLVTFGQGPWTRLPPVLSPVM